MATLTKGKTFVNGETVTPQKLHELVDLGGVEGIVNADIAAGAAIADTKLAQITTANKVAQSAVVNLTTDLAGKAAASHTHDDRYYTETEVNTLLAGKAAASHTHDDRYYTETEVNTLLAEKAAASHTHTIANVTGLQTALDGKQAAGSYVTNGGSVSSIQRVTSMPATPAANTLYIVIP